MRVVMRYTAYMKANTSIIVSVMLAIACFSVPFAASAATLTSAQVQAIVGLLQAFGADQALVTSVEQSLGVTTAPTQSVPVSVPASPVAPTTPSMHVPPVGSIYPSSSVGFDISFNSLSYPVDRFNFGIAGVSGGKAFVHNARLATEYSWTKFGAVASTVYMNLNAPYGSTVAGHTSSPKVCPASAVSTNTTPTEPTACEGYNYGYNAAQDAFAYAKSNGVQAVLWWLDIEEANSWSLDTAVNDATIQGAIDYLNSQGTRVGIYSMQYMWNDIAGSSFVPTQTINGNVVSIPAWVPIGITNIVGALNACVTKNGLFAGSPIWLIQYVANSTAVDQNIAC